MKNFIKKLINFINSISKDKLLIFIAYYIITHFIISLISAIFVLCYGGCIIGFVAATFVFLIIELYNNLIYRHSFRFYNFLYCILGSITASLITLMSTF